MNTKYGYAVVLLSDSIPFVSGDYQVKQETLERKTAGVSSV